jgi:hypothetical protein
MTTQSITKSAAEPQATVVATGHADPSARAGALPRAHRWRARYPRTSERERWGYGVWLFGTWCSACPRAGQGS